MTGRALLSSNLEKTRLTKRFAGALPLAKWQLEAPTARFLMFLELGGAKSTCLLVFLDLEAPAARVFSCFWSLEAPKARFLVGITWYCGESACFLVFVELGGAKSTCFLVGIT